MKWNWYKGICYCRLSKSLKCLIWRGTMLQLRVSPPWWDEAFPLTPWCRWLNALRRESTAFPLPSSETETLVAHGWSCPSRSLAPGWETLNKRVCAGRGKMEWKRVREIHIQVENRHGQEHIFIKGAKTGTERKLNKENLSWPLLIYRCIVTY